MPDTNLSKSIMRRVYLVYFVRQLVSPLFLKFAVLAVFLWQIKEAVFVRQVFANMANYEATELLNFWSAAFMNTELIVQFTALGVGVLAILLFRDIVFKRDQGFVFARSI